QAYGRALAGAGVASTVRSYDGMIHGFFGLTVAFDDAKSAMDDVAVALREAFGTLG
ncbi:MAG: acetyl esterase, partial [Actinomycetota bacterium]|nr:acetyl esterase [Actinomycetota bacterium]